MAGDYNCQLFNFRGLIGETPEAFSQLLKRGTDGLSGSFPQILLG